MKKRPLTEQERKDLRVLIDILYQLTDEVKKPNSKLTSRHLHGGLLPFLGVLLGLAARAIPAALTAARAVVPAVLRTIGPVGRQLLARASAQLGSRLVPAFIRTASSAGQRAVSSAQRTLLNAARRSGELRSAVATGSRPAGATQGLAGQSIKRGLINKVGTAMNLGAAGNVIADLNTGDVGYEDIPDGEEYYTDYRPETTITYAHEDVDVPQRESAPEPDAEEVPEPEETGTFNIAPLRYAPRVRNVFTAAQSRNPVSTARTPSAVSAPVGATPVRARDIGVFRGSGVVRRRRVLKKYGLEDKGYSLDELASITGVPKDTLQEVYNRGIGAYKTNPKSVRMKVSFKKNVDAPMSQKLSKEQWAMARVYSFLDGNPKHDTDLRPVVISKPDFVKEHTKLIDVLTKGSKKQRLAEAKEQKTELEGKGQKSGFVAKRIAMGEAGTLTRVAKPSADLQRRMGSATRTDYDKVKEALDTMIELAKRYAEWSEPAAKEAKVDRMTVKRDEVKYVVDDGEDYSYRRQKAMILTYRLRRAVKGSDVVVNRNDPNPPFPQISILGKDKKYNSGKKLEVVVIDAGFLYLAKQLEEAKRVWEEKTELKGKVRGGMDMGVAPPPPPPHSDITAILEELRPQIEDETISDESIQKLLDDRLTEEQRDIFNAFKEAIVNNLPSRRRARFKWRKNLTRLIEDLHNDVDDDVDYATVSDE